MAHNKTPLRKVEKSNLVFNEKKSVVFVDNKPLLQTLRRSYKWEVEFSCGHQRTMTIAQAHNRTPTEARCRQCCDGSPVGGASKRVATPTGPQLRQLMAMQEKPQPTYGAARVRVQNNLVEKGLAKYQTAGGRPPENPWDTDQCVITEAGQAALRERGRAKK